MADIPEYKLKIFVDALQVHFNQQPISDFAENDLTASIEDWSLYDESGYDIAADLIDGHSKIKKGRRKIAQRAWNEGEAGRAAKKAWNESKQAKEAKKAWNESEAGRAVKKAWRQSEAAKASKNTWKKSETGNLSTNATKRKESLDRHLNRRIVGIDSEGRCPLHMIDNKGRTPLDTYKETGFVSKYLTKDSSGHYWEPHELSLIGAASINRPYGTPIEKGNWEPPVWAEIKAKQQSEQAFEYLLSLPDHYNEAKGRGRPRRTRCGRS